MSRWEANCPWIVPASQLFHYSTAAVLFRPGTVALCGVGRKICMKEMDHGQVVIGTLLAESNSGIEKQKNQQRGSLWITKM